MSMVRAMHVVLMYYLFGPLCPLSDFNEIFTKYHVEL